MWLSIECNQDGICWVACRRNPDQRTIWVRIVESIFPNYLQIGCTFPSARRERRSQTVWTRWHVPVDDTNSLLIGWRHFNDEVDPDHLGRPEDCGLEKLDFMGGMVGDRSYEEGQRAPGDWEALMSMRPIAIHALENPGASDKGVYQERKLLREILRGNTPPDTTQEISANGKDTLHIYTQDSVINIWHGRRQGRHRADAVGRSPSPQDSARRRQCAKRQTRSTHPRPPRRTRWRVLAGHGIGPSPQKKARLQLE